MLFDLDCRCLGLDVALGSVGGRCGLRCLRLTFGSPIGLSSWMSVWLSGCLVSLGALIFWWWESSILSASSSCALEHTCVCLVPHGDGVVNLLFSSSSWCSSMHLYPPGWCPAT